MSSNTEKRKYPEETIKATKESIIHWKEVVAAHKASSFGIPNTNRDSCALCNLFNNDDTEYTYTACINCPIADKTERIGCRGTPYTYYVSKHTAENAQKMVDFLEEVLEGMQILEEITK